MTYGINILNAAGELVMDGSTPTYLLDSETTVSGTSVTAGWNFANTPAGTLRFWKLEVGDAISKYPGGFIGNKSSFQIRDVKRASLFSTPSGYGLVTFDASGALTYASASSLLAIGDKYSVPNGGSATTSDEWVALESWQVALAVVGPTTGARLSAGVQRNTSTTYIQYRRIYASAPRASVIPPVNFITAK